MPLDKPTQRLTNFVIARQQYCFRRLFYGISIGPATFSSFMSSIFKPLTRKNNFITNLDDVFIQDTTTTNSLATGNTFINPVIILKKEESLKIVLEARQLNNMIDNTKRSSPIEQVQIILT